jgi:hypothetical protein
VLVTADAASVDRVGQALRDSGFEITFLESEVPQSADLTIDDRKGLRAKVEALVNQADESELARLEAAATAEPSDDLDERFWGPAPDSVTAVKAVVDDLSEQFAQRRRLAEDSLSREEAAKLL